MYGSKNKEKNTLFNLFMFIGLPKFNQNTLKILHNHFITINFQCKSCRPVINWIYRYTLDTRSLRHRMRDIFSPYLCSKKLYHVNEKTTSRLIL